MLQADLETTFIQEEENEASVCERPLLADPYESKWVYVDESKIPGAGAGLFAKANISCGQVVAYFNGVKQKGGVNGSEYSIWCGEGMIDIPEKCRDVDVYRATLAHKICHSFEPNAFYGHAYHPRLVVFELASIFLFKLCSF